MPLWQWQEVQAVPRQAQLSPAARLRRQVVCRQPDPCGAGGGGRPERHSPVNLSSPT
ncbi:MAG: hypothetical protein LW854_01635 [Rubrivivax sp.]|nr:hypothetical protein [Rubrivivax sp.]